MNIYKRAARLLWSISMGADIGFLVHAVKADNTIEKYGLNAVCTHLGCVVPWVGVSPSLLLSHLPKLMHQSPFTGMRAVLSLYASKAQLHHGF